MERNIRVDPRLSNTNNPPDKKEISARYYENLIDLTTSPSVFKGYF